MNETDKEMCVSDAEFLTFHRMQSKRLISKSGNSRNGKKAREKDKRKGRKVGTSNCHLATGREIYILDTKKKKTK